MGPYRPRPQDLEEGRKTVGRKENTVSKIKPNSVV
jgi:hypothetical protein